MFRNYRGNVTWSPFVPRGENTAFASGFTKKGVH